MALQKFIQIQAVFLAGSGITANDTTFVVKSLQYPNGVKVVTADIGSLCYATLEPNTAREEIISFTTITQNSDDTATLTGVTRNLKYYHPYDQISATGFPHPGGSSLVVSNNPQIYENFLSANNTETITGQYTFDSSAIPRVSNSATMPTNDEDLAHKKYVDEVAIAGAPDGNETTKGLYQTATSAQTQAGTDVGSTGATLAVKPSDISQNIVNNKFLFAEDTGIADAYVIALTPALASYELGQVIYFKATNTNTGTSTIDINGLGVKSIKKLKNTDLEAGDIEAGALVSLGYDGTNFVMLNPQATMPTTAILNEMSTFFGATDITGAEAESLRDGSAVTIHKHPVFSGSFPLYNMGGVEDPKDFVVNTLTGTPKKITISGYIYLDNSPSPSPMAVFTATWIATGEAQTGLGIFRTESSTYSVSNPTYFTTPVFFSSTLSSPFTQVAVTMHEISSTGFTLRVTKSKQYIEAGMAFTYIVEY
jgi:hypothetical protein